MKYPLIISLFLIFAAACSKDSSSSSTCETVINPNGPAFIKIVNNRSETVLVYFGNFNLSFGAELKGGICEIYGVPNYNRVIVISTLDGAKSKDVLVNAKDGQTTIITVGINFF